MHFFSQDVVNISYHSDYAKPTLYLWCEIGRKTQQCELHHTSCLEINTDTKACSGKARELSIQ